MSIYAYAPNREEAGRIIQQAGLTGKLSAGEYGALVALIAEGLGRAEKRGVGKFLKKLEQIAEETE